MRNRYPRESQKSKGEFEVIGERELALRCARRPLDRRRVAGSGEEVPQGERLSGTGEAGEKTESRVALPSTGGLKCDRDRAATFN